MKINKFFLTQFFSIAFTIFAMKLSAEVEEHVNIIERSNASKILEVKKLLTDGDVRLKNYYTFNLKVRGVLVYCHIAKDDSKPQIICY